MIALLVILKCLLVMLAIASTALLLDRVTS